MNIAWEQKTDYLPGDMNGSCTLDQLSHDIRTPLTVIRSHAQIIQRLSALQKLTPEKLSELTRTIDAEAVRLNELFEQWLQSQGGE